MILTRNSEALWKLLKGVVCIYKPADVSSAQVRSTIITKLAKELSELDCRPALPYISIEGNPSTKLTVNVRPSYADHPLVLGPRYQNEDFRCNTALSLGKESSGILILGINGGTKDCDYFSKYNRDRKYHLTGKFGEMSENKFRTGKIIEKSTFTHIKKHKLDHLLASIEASHHAKKFDLWGVDPQSKAAYELLSSDFKQVENTKIPLFHSIKCIDFKPPYFTLEVHCVNEYDVFLHTLIHEIGIKLKSTAHCRSVHCIQHANFTLENALLKKHWCLQHILDNISASKNVINETLQIRQQEKLNQPLKPLII